MDGSLRDFNTAGVVAAHLSKPLTALRSGRYKVHGVDVQVDGSRVAECNAGVDAIIRRV